MIEPILVSYLEEKEKEELEKTNTLGCKRTRSFRRAADKRAQNRQRNIAKSLSMLEPGADAKPRWRKVHALSCKSNCGFCRNPRFNRTSSGKERLTVAELKSQEHFDYTLSALSPEDFDLLQTEDPASAA